MSERRNHYELAFEWYLNQRETPFVAIEDVRHLVKGRIGAKAFDYIVYPEGRKPALVDVKGRKLAHSEYHEGLSPNNWVTRADVVSMEEWQRIFGREYEAVFAFAYWLSGADRADARPPTQAGDSAITYVGRRYCLRLVSLADYSKHQKQRSKRWDTLALPGDVFKRVSRPLENAWPCRSAS